MMHEAEDYLKENGEMQVLSSGGGILQNGGEAETEELEENGFPVFWRIWVLRGKAPEQGAPVAQTEGRIKIGVSGRHSGFIFDEWPDLYHSHHIGGRWKSA